MGVIRSGLVGEGCKGEPLGEGCIGGLVGCWAL